MQTSKHVYGKTLLSFNKSRRERSNAAFLLLKYQLTAFSLVEVLVSFALIAILAGAITSVFNSGNTAFKLTRSDNLLEATVDKDLAVVKDISFRLTCCSGSCTTNQTSINNAATCTEKTAGRQNYYFPKPGTTIADTPEITSFKSKCNSTGLVDDLVSAIQSETSGSTLPDGILRSFDKSQADRHRLTVNYTSGTQSKSYTLTPTVSAWCP